MRFKKWNWVTENGDTAYVCDSRSDSIQYQKRGAKRYELSNHLGNVLAVITDRRIQACETGELMHYEAQIVQVMDYYSFGSLIENRSWSASKVYRYGFNGMERDDNAKGKGNSLDFGARIYDSRLGRWLSVDPFVKKYPEMTPFHFCKNNPLFLKDPDGKDAIVTVRHETRKFLFFKRTRRTLIINANYHYIQGSVNNVLLEAVSDDWNNPKDKMKATYQGEKYNVEYNIQFIPHEENTDLSQYNGNNGENRLVVGETVDGTLEESNFQEIILNLEGIQNGGVQEGYNGDLPVSLSDGQINSRLKSVISHGVGHNIGMTHDDLGVMRHQEVTITTQSANSPAGTTVPAYQVSENKVTPWNTTRLVERLDQMTNQGRAYWEGQVDGEGNRLDNSGVSRVTARE